MTEPHAPILPTPTPYVRPDVAAFLAYLNAAPGPKLHEMDAPAARALYRSTKDVAELPVGELATIADLSVPGPAGAIPARLFDARAARSPGPLIVFFHGGGFVIGDLDTHAGFCAEAARTLDLPVLSVDYRLAPEHPWPAAPDDAEAAARWAAGSPAALGRGVTGLVLCGDSAGAALAITTATALRDAPAAAPVLVQAPIYPPIDWSREYPSYRQFKEGFLLTERSLAWFSDAYRADMTHPRAAPFLADLAGLPPAVIVTAGLDPIRDQGRAYAARLIEAGVPVTYREAAGNVHGFVTLRRAIPSSVADVSAFLSALRAAVSEAEGARVQRQAAG